MPKVAMSSKEFKAFLERYNAGKVIVAWAESLGFDPVRCWNECQRGEWLLWWAARVPSLDRKVLVKAAVECAATALPYTNDERVHRCIEVTRLWCDGKASYKELHKVAEDAWAAAWDAEAARWAAGWDAAWDPARAAARAAAWAAWAGGYAAAWAAAMAAENAAWAAEAVCATHKQHAEIVRSIIPLEAVLKGGCHE